MWWVTKQNIEKSKLGYYPFNTVLYCTVCSSTWDSFRKVWFGVSMFLGCYVLGEVSWKANWRDDWITTSNRKTRPELCFFLLLTVGGREYIWSLDEFTLSWQHLGNCVLLMLHRWQTTQRGISYLTKGYVCSLSFLILHEERGKMLFSKIFFSCEACLKTQTNKSTTKGTWYKVN